MANHEHEPDTTADDVLEALNAGEAITDPGHPVEALDPDGDGDPLDADAPAPPG